MASSSKNHQSNSFYDEDDDNVVLNMNPLHKRKRKIWLRLLFMCGVSFLIILTMCGIAYWFFLRIFPQSKVLDIGDNPRLPTVWTTTSLNSLNTTYPNHLNLSKVATIIETRPHPSLVPLIMHFAAVLGDDWPINIFYSPENEYLFKYSASFQKYLATGRFKLTLIPNHTLFKSQEAISKFMANRWFWEQLAPASFVLVFQLDSMICANSPLRVEDFFQYDMIGAPITEEWGANGGLSLRRREKMLEVIDKFDWETEKLNEDIWFLKNLWQIGNAHLPSMETSKTFSVEQFWNPRPLGYHQGFYHHWMNGTKMNSWCPEERIAVGPSLY